MTDVTNAVIVSGSINHLNENLEKSNRIMTWLTASMVALSIVNILLLLKQC